MRGSRVASIAALACALVATLTSSAGAAVTIGQTAPHPEPSFCAGFLTFDEVTESVASGPSYAVPAGGGVITGWATMGGLNEGKSQILALDIFRRVGYAVYTKVAADGPRPVTPETMNTFAVEIPVKGGDLIGASGPSFFEKVGSSCFFETGDPNDEEGFIEPGMKVGESGEFSVGGNGFRANISATLVPPPTISSLTPSSGTISGGSSVKIAGANFAKVQGVTFGGVPAAGFSVQSENQITAKAPKRKAPGAVAVSVTTFAGTTGVPATFTYKPCRARARKGSRTAAARARSKVPACKRGKKKPRG